MNYKDGSNEYTYNIEIGMCVDNFLDTSRNEWNTIACNI